MYKIAAFLLPHFFALVLLQLLHQLHAQHGWGKGTNLVFPLGVLMHIAKSALRYQHQGRCHPNSMPPMTWAWSLFFLTVSSCNGMVPPDKPPVVCSIEVPV